MTEFYESKIVQLIGTPDGVTKQFSTPSAFVSGTIRVVRDGLIYKTDDDKWGWMEISDSVIEFNEAPVVGDTLQAFYQEASPVPGISNVKGSPFHPNDTYP